MYALKVCPWEILIYCNNNNKKVMNNQTRIYLTFIFPIILGLTFIALIASIIFSYGSRLFLLSTDFRAFYTGGQMLLNGVSYDFYNLDTQYNFQHKFAPEVSPKNLMPFVYPSFVALPFAPLAFLPLDKAYLVWLFLNILLLIFILRSILKLTNEPPKSIKILLLSLILLFFPLWNALLQGQLSFLITLSVLQAYVALRSNKNVSAGLWLALLLVRPNLVIVPALVLFVGRRFHALLGLALGSSILLVISLLLVGSKGLFEYINLLRAAFSWGDAYTMHPQLEPTWRGFLQTVANSDYVKDIQLLWFLGVIGAIGLLLWPRLTRFWVWRKSHASSSSHFDLAFAFMIIIMIFTSPHTNYHDLTLLIVPGVLIVSHLSKKKKYDIQDKLLFIILFLGYIVITVAFHAMFFARLHLAAPFMILAMAILVSRLVSLNKYKV